MALGCALILSACACAGLDLEPPAHLTLRPRGPPPAQLSQRLEALALNFDGKVGLAVEDVQDGWVAAYDGTMLYPQQSVAKLWVALAVFDAADRGQIGLADPVVVRSADMSVFNQPMQKMLEGDAYATSIDGLLAWSLAQSDNAANDILIRKLPSGAVRRLIDRRRLGPIRAGGLESLLEAKIAGLEWRAEYSFGRAFWDARDQLPPAIRQAKLDAYVADPDDGASPIAVVGGLSRLKRGELLSPASTARFLQIMQMAQTGPMRLKAGIAPGWDIAHKTGTGQDLADESTGYNDVGLLTAPDGRTYAVAVMIAATRKPVPDRQTLMAEVARAVVAQHDGVDETGAQ